MRRLTIIIALMATFFAACDSGGQTSHSQGGGSLAAEKNNTADWPRDEYGIPLVDLEETVYETIYGDIHIRKCLFYSYTGFLTMDYFIEYPQISKFFEDSEEQYEIKKKINEQIYHLVIDDDLSKWNPGISFRYVEYEVTLIHDKWFSVYFRCDISEGMRSWRSHKSITFNLETGEKVDVKP